MSSRRSKSAHCLLASLLLSLLIPMGAALAATDRDAPPAGPQASTSPGTRGPSRPMPWPALAPGRDVAPRPACDASTTDRPGGRQTHEAVIRNGRIDACGVPHMAAGAPAPLGGLGRLDPAGVGVTTPGATIDSMTTGRFYTEPSSPWIGISTLGGARTYYLNDGSTRAPPPTFTLATATSRSRAIRCASS